MIEKFLSDSNSIYEMMAGQHSDILRDHTANKIKIVVTSIVLTDQFNNDLDWEGYKKRILDFIEKNNIEVIKIPDMVWHTEKEPKDLPGPFIIGASSIASDIWGGDDSGGLVDKLGSVMFNNFKNLKRRSGVSESERRDYFGSLLDVYQAIAAIENKIPNIISSDKSFQRVKNLILLNYGITVIKPSEYK